MPITRLHRVVALVACLLVPLATFAFGRDAVGYTMYAGLTTYRLRAFATKGGSTTRVSCNEVAHALGGSSGLYLTGADDWRTARSTRALRSQLGAVARAACVASGADSVEVELDERGASSARARRECR